MNAEGSREKELFWHIWYIRTGLSRDEAHREFLTMKPRDYTFDKFFYDRNTGRVRTI